MSELIKKNDSLDIEKTLRPYPESGPDETISISPAALSQLDPQDHLLIDVRDESSFSMGNIPGSRRISREDLLSGNHDLPKDKKIILYCMFGVLSLEAAKTLNAQGYNAANLEGGYGRWLVQVMQQDADDRTRLDEIEKSLRKKFKKEIMSRFVRAINDYELIQEGDRIAVCISGGKDSMLMAKCFQELKRRNKFNFDLTFLVMNPGYTDVTLQMILNNAKLLNIPITMFESDIFDAVYNIEKSPCYLCARMRRGYLYSKAKELGCNKIALGHHFDDVIETTLMSILYSGQTQTMMPKLHSTNFEGMELIRPMYYIREADVKRWRDHNGLTFIRCACRFTDTCSVDESNPGATGDSGSKRLEVKRLIAKLKETNPHVETNLLRSMENIHLNAVLGYKKDGVKHSFLDSYETGSEV